MIKITILLVVCVVLAHYSEMRTNEITSSGHRYSVWQDPAYLALVTVLVLYTGLRKSYNDTQNYVQGFKQAPTLFEFMENAEDINLFQNPLFYFLQSLLKGITKNGYVLIFLSSLFTQICFLLCIKRYATSFAFSVFLYFTLGTFNVTMAALKQVLAMSVGFLAMPYLERKQWLRFYILVFIAMLLHTYALIYVFLPLVRLRPWRLFTYVFLAALVALMMNFKETISSFMDQANELGKTLEDYEVFHEHGMNLFRVAVYAVVPLLSFVFQHWLNREYDVRNSILIHMSLVSLAFMVMGTQGGANMFGRMAHYFEIGIICGLPWILEKVFTPKSNRLISGITAACFFGFFAYANGAMG